MYASMEWRHLDHLWLLSRAKYPFTAMAQNEVCPRDEIVDPPGMNVFPVDRYGVAEGFEYFRTLYGV